MMVVLDPDLVRMEFTPYAGLVPYPKDPSKPAPPVPPSATMKMDIMGVKHQYQTRADRFLLWATNTHTKMTDCFAVPGNADEAKWTEILTFIADFRAKLLAQMPEIKPLSRKETAALLDAFIANRVDAPAQTTHLASLPIEVEDP
jgi:hypothetical protein